MADVDSQSLLDGVNSAINAFMAGGGISEYTLPTGQRVKRESLDVLMNMRARLQAEVASQSQPMFRPVILGRNV